MAVWTIARLTMKEASRRRLMLALLLLTVVVILLTGWGFQRLTTIKDHGRLVPVGEMRALASQLLILVMFMFSFVLALSAAFVSAPTISSEVESGITLSILARPVRRSHVVLGKWAGFTILIVIYTIAATTLELLLVRWATGYHPVHPVEMEAYLVVEGITLLTLTLLFSTRLSAITGGVVAIVLFGMAWMAGVVGNFGIAFQNDTVTRVGTVSRLLLPTDGLWRGANFSLEPPEFIATTTQGGRGAQAFPFFVASPPNTAYLAWVALWLVIMLGLAIWSFRNRET
ncbi:MAG: ABC transporter permease subunit [Candidatus Dormibacteraceae bacterium]